MRYRKIKTVLILDDLPECRDLLSRYLTKRVDKVLSASNGLNAFNMLESNHIDLIITDISMPELDGLQLLKICRALYYDLPIILSSASDHLPPVTALGIDPQSVYRLPKPIDFERLESLLDLADHSYFELNKAETGSVYM